MQLANIAWDDLIVYLEVLIGGQVVSRQVVGKKTSYSVTPKGHELLASFQEFKRDAAFLRLETVNKDRILKALKAPDASLQGGVPSDVLEKRLRNAGFKILDNSVVGKSGVMHSFGVAAQDQSGSKHGYVMFKTIDQTQILGLFVKQIDTDFIVHGFSIEEISPAARDMAKTYSLDVSNWPK